MFIVNKAEFKTAVAQTVARAARINDGFKSRRFDAIFKAADEIRANDSMQISNGQLSFISRASGKPRRVTAFGCSDACDCRNTICYHRFAYEIAAAYVVALNQSLQSAAPKVIQFPMKTLSTVLTYVENGTETSLCRNCGEVAAISLTADRLDYRKHSADIKHRHVECHSRPPHPHRAEHLAKRIAEIEAMNAAPLNGKSWIQDLLVEEDSEFYRSGEVEGFYGAPERWAEAA